MPEWTVTIDSAEGAAHDADALEAFTESLMTDGRPLHPATSLNTETGVLSATFQILAENRQEAAFAASLAYWGAIAAAGAELRGESRLLVSLEGDDEHSESFVANASVEHVA